MASVLAGAGLASATVAGVTPAPCQVIGAEKLPAAAGGAEAICAAVQHAISAQAPGVRYRAIVKVVGPARLTTALVVNGHQLPDQNFAVMDRNLNPASLERFAHSIAAAVAKASKA